MKTLSYLILTLATLYGANAYAIQETKDVLRITTKALGRSIDFTSDTTTSTRDKLKLIHAAKSDAATYVATRGNLHGPYLTQAIRFIRSEFPAARDLSNMDLATIILAAQSYDL